MGGDYYIDENNKPTKCKRTEDLYNEIINSNISFNKPIRIGLSIGCAPIGEAHPSMQLINNGIQELIQRLKESEISAYLAPNQYEMNFILDARDGTIIKPSRFKHTEIEEDIER